MPKSKVLVALALTIFFLQLFDPMAALSQRAEIDQRTIRTLIDEWNFANNTRSAESFAKVYSSDLIFYGKFVSKARAVELKQKLFKTNPDFRQRIVSDIQYTAYTSGVVKCDFTKEVREFARWKQRPAYLLVSYNHGRYRITGESDYATDKTSGYRLSIGEPMQLNPNDITETSGPIPDSMIESQSAVVDSTPSLSMSDGDADGTDSMTFAKQADNRTSVTALLSPQETVTVRKDHVFVLIGILILGALMIFAADTTQKGMRKPAGAMRKNGHDEQAEGAWYRAQTQFRNFVLTLFDPLYFRPRRNKKDRVLAGNVSSPGMAADLEFQFRHKEDAARFSVHCVYQENLSGQKVQLLTRDELTKLKYFAADLDGDLYYVMGVGGRPDDPRELFVIPASQIDREFITREELEPYRKSGMFFYNNATGRLQ